MKNCILLSILLIGFLSCAKKTTPTNKMTNTASTIPTPAWAKNAIIYEVNIRQYSKEGNFDSFKKHLNRLKNLGVDIIWFMPIYPISEVGRKGTLGSPYAVADYKKVNPNYGTMDDFKSLVQTIHNMGMKVIIDWVPNHTGWDNVWIKEHPDWYTHVGEAITHPLNNDGSSTGWTDVADLNYNNKAMRKAMIEAMTFWLKTTNIDGFRVDMSGMVPDDFWQEARPSLLAANKNIFMLSEWEDAPDHFSTFHVNYGWQLHHTTAEIAKGIKK
ncbi:MAG: alpha-amylase family glycosyl hydrolase, partial [Saprospiraceae bacterium]